MAVGRGSPLLGTLDFQQKRDGAVKVLLQP
jgi:hypothetical protein